LVSESMTLSLNSAAVVAAAGRETCEI